MKHRRARIGSYGFIGAEKLIKFALPPYKIYKKISRVIPVKKMNPQGGFHRKIYLVDRTWMPVFITASSARVSDRKRCKIPTMADIKFSCVSIVKINQTLQSDLHGWNNFSWWDTDNISLSPCFLPFSSPSLSLFLSIYRQWYVSISQSSLNEIDYRGSFRHAFACQTLMLHYKYFQSIVMTIFALFTLLLLLSGFIYFPLIYYSFLFYLLYFAYGIYLI